MELYFYNGIVKEVYDGDTMTVDIDLGLGIWARGQKMRLARINAPEIRGDSYDEGIVVRDFVRGLTLNKAVVIKTIKDQKEKYGRYLVEVYIDGKNLNDMLLEHGMAVPY
jgi:micrococcal nuclease